MQFEIMTEENFGSGRLKDFLRHQAMHEAWRRVDGRLQLVKVEHTHDWNAEAIANKEKQILAWLSHGYGVMAVDEGRIVGFAVMDCIPIGNQREYLQLHNFHVSEEHRGQGIGKQMFAMIVAQAKALGARKQYISANSSKETQAVYRKLGCVEAAWIHQPSAESEPCDVQMEFVL